jgi:hypothetical protein
MDAITRQEKLLDAVGSGKASGIKPITREEMFLSYAAGESDRKPSPVTRKEMFLDRISGGGGGGFVPSGEIEITENGVHDVAQYATANVNVASAGGGGLAISDVNFADYDGTILYAYTAEEAAALAELPELPSHDGLICQGWNYTLDEMKECVAEYGACDAGAMYITDDGKTRIYITLDGERRSPSVGFAVNGTATIEWGDGTSDTVTGTSTASNAAIYTQHHYEKKGEYVIAISAVSGTIGLIGSYVNYAGGETRLITSEFGESNGATYYYQGIVNKIEVGENVEKFLASFGRLRNLKSITLPIPTRTTAYDSGTFSYCVSLRGLIIPNGIQKVGSRAISSCTTLTYVSIPMSQTNSSNAEYVFSYCDKIKRIINHKQQGSSLYYAANNLERFKTSKKISSVSANSFAQCYSLLEITISKEITVVYGTAFNLTGLKKIRFEKTSPTRLYSSESLYGIPTDCVISVPVGSLEAYTTATNYPSAETYTYIEE